MRKLIHLTLLIILASCGDEIKTKVLTGSISNNLYKNNSIGFCFEIPSDYRPYSVDDKNRAIAFEKMDYEVEINDLDKVLLVGLDGGGHDISLHVMNPYKINSEFPGSIKKFQFEKLRKNVNGHKLDIKSTEISFVRIDEREFHKFYAEYSIVDNSYTEYANYFFTKNENLIIMFEMVSQEKFSREILEKFVRNTNNECF